MRYWKIGLAVALTAACLTLGGTGVNAATNTGAAVGQTVAEFVVLPSPYQPGKPGKLPSRGTPTDHVPGTKSATGQTHGVFPKTGETIALVLAGVGFGLLGLIAMMLLLLWRRREDATNETLN